jgi:nitrogen fixation protein NifX
MRIALTTDDLEHVDAAFGQARHLVTYEVSRGAIRQLARFDFPPHTGSCNDQALRRRAAALKNCLLVYTLEICRAGRLHAIRQAVSAIPVARRRPIAEVLEALRAGLAGRHGPWMRWALGIAGAPDEEPAPERVPAEAQAS